MQQYFQNKIPYEQYAEKNNEAVSITKPELKQNRYTDIVFAGYRWDAQAVFDNIRFDNCVFSKLGLKKSKFTHINMGHSVFISCYFKGTCFNYCDFTGAVFIDCNFDEATFVDCEFLYAQFKECYITYDAIKNNLPRKWHNLTRDLCRNLGLEALHAGDDENFRKYYFEEKRANERYYLKKFHHSKTEDGGYYYNKYNVWDECSGLFHFLLSKLNHVLWGYGERLGRLIVNMCIVVTLYWIIYEQMPILREGKALRWYDGLYISLSNFFTMSPVASYTFPNSWAYQFASVSEAGIGVIFVGFFVAAVFRYINRRS